MNVYDASEKEQVGHYFIFFCALYERIERACKEEEGRKNAQRQPEMKGKYKELVKKSGVGQCRWVNWPSEKG